MGGSQICVLGKISAQNSRDICCIHYLLLCKNHSQTEWFKTITLARGVGCFVLVLLMDLRFAFGQYLGGDGVFLFHVAGGVHF